MKSAIKMQAFARGSDLSRDNGKSILRLKATRPHSTSHRTNESGVAALQEAVRSG